jgi:hypothetical protein
MFCSSSSRNRSICEMLRFLDRLFGCRKWDVGGDSARAKQKDSGLMSCRFKHSKLSDLYCQAHSVSAFGYFLASANGRFTFPSPRRAHERNRPSRLSPSSFARSIVSLPNMSLQPTCKKRSRLNSIVRLFRVKCDGLIL